MGNSIILQIVVGLLFGLETIIIANVFISEINYYETDCRDLVEKDPAVADNDSVCGDYGKHHITMVVFIMIWAICLILALVILSSPIEM